MEGKRHTCVCKSGCLASMLGISSIDGYNEYLCGTHYHFQPTDEVLMRVLNYKICNKPYCFNLIIPEVNLYRHHPRQLTEWYKPFTRPTAKKVWYFFSLKDKKYPYPYAYCTPEGYWMPTGSRITDGGHRLERRLEFYQGNHPGGTRTEWVMHEYSIDQDDPRAINGMTLDEWALCKIYLKEENENHSTEEEEEEEEEEEDEEEHVWLPNADC